MANIQLIRTSGELKSKKLENDFLQQHWPQEYKIARNAVLIIGIANVLTIFGDLHKEIEAHHLYIMIFLKSFILFYALIYAKIIPNKMKHYNLMTFGFQLLNIIYQCFSTFITPHNQLLEIIQLALTAAFFLVIPLRSKWFYLPPLLMYIGFLAARLLTIIPNQTYFIGSNILFISSNIIFAYFLITIRSYQREQFVSKKHMKNLMESKDLFFRIFAHDFRNPLTSVQATLTVLSKKIDNQPLEKSKNMIQRNEINLKNLRYLLENMNEWILAQDDLSKMAISNITNESLLTALTPIKDQIEKYEIKIKNTGPPFKIQFNESVIFAAIRNIVSNGIKFSQPGSEIHLQSELINHQVVIHIQDSGMGMDQDKCDSLFAGESNIPAEGTSGQKGSGVGLIIVKQFLNLHGAELSFTSELGKGTRFSIITNTYNQS